jgi:ATP-dependent phosphofructokinase / diphosphate-dependent phosphofructokinase
MQGDSVMRVGILTGGGDCSGLNAVIRATSKSLILHHGAEVLGFEDGFLGLIERRMRYLSYPDVSGILAMGGTILGTHNRANPFAYFGQNGQDVSDGCLDYAHELGLDGLVVIGGDGTMSIAHEMALKGMKIVGVPKTIDNDLQATDQSFGFDTAVHVVTEAIDRLQSTGRSHGRVMIVETMGRYAGWIALAGGIAGGADIVLVPELPYEVEEVVRVCQARQLRQRFTIICIAEGATSRGGEMTVRETIAESPDPIRLGGAAEVLREAIQPKLDAEIRTTVLGHIQRGGTPTAADRILATQYGTHAATLVAASTFSVMAAMQGGILTTVPLSSVAHAVRTVPLNSPLFETARGVGMSLGVC